ncbi:hypothetical protein N9X25_06740 [Verrucomicrobiales bacterium]|jgi:hypothetical protein|nr:hypothetical protein [Verrucomicrobiales bacterium]
MEKNDRYRNGIGAIALCRLALGCLLLLAAGVGFVLMRNDHVLVGQEIRALEDRAKDLDRNIEMWELRIAGIHDRQEISRRLRWVQSDLFEIESAKVIEISPAGQVQGGPFKRASVPAGMDQGGRQ